MKVAIVYDRVNKWGGAERLLLTLHEIFPESPLYTSFYSPEKAKWAQNFPRIYTSKLNIISFLRTKHELLGTLMPLIFESFDFSRYDLVISVTSEFAKGIITKGITSHICICLTPTRYLWSHYGEYFKGGIMKDAIKIFSRPFVAHLRKWDVVSAYRPDKIVAISRDVQNRVKKYYNRESQIIFPPFDYNYFNSFKIQSYDTGKQTGKQKYFLIVSRLVPYKKVDLAIEVFNELFVKDKSKKLLIAGKGSQEKRLKKYSRGNIEFLGELTDKKLASYYRNARALIMPQYEDFGLVSVEAQSFGIPVIAYNKGGARDTIIDGVTGIFFDKQNKQSLTRAVERFERTKFDRSKIIENAKRFSKENFKKSFLRLIRET